MRPDEYDRIYAAEQVHWWYRSLHEIVLLLLGRYVFGATEDSLAAVGGRGSRRAAGLPGEKPDRLGGSLALPDSEKPGRAPKRRPAVLDAGCGTGGMARVIFDFAEVTGLDVSRRALDYSRRRGLGRLIEGSVSALPFREASFDAVISLDVLYHAAVGDDQLATRELARVLRPGGVLILNLPAYDWLRGSHDVVIATARRYTRGRVRELLKGAGLELIWVSHWNTLLFLPAAAVRLARRRSHPSGQSDVGPVSPALNRVLTFILDAERRLLRRARLPFGLSVIAVGRRP